MQNISQLDLRIKASDFKKKLNIQDGKDGKDGSDYVLTEKDKKQISEMIKVPVVEKIVETIKIEKPFYEMDKKTLKSIEKLINSTFKKISWDDIKDKPDIVSYIIKTISAKTYSLSELDDIDISALIKNSDGKYVLGTAADEKVKYDVSDPTAGYLADKIVAGNGISIAEGTGTDENKVKITNTSLAGVGGYSAPLYFTTDASDVAGYYKISYNNQPTEVELSGVVNNEEKLLRTYLHDDIINTTVIDAGIWAATFRVKVSNATQETTLKFEAFLRHTDNTETTLFSAYSDEINNTDYANLEKNTPQPVFACVATDRLGARVYAKTTSHSNITVSTIVGDGNASWFTAPLALRHNLLRAMQGGTTDEYYHLTAAEHTASTQLATNIQNGLLSSSDWTTFNSKAPTNNPIFTGSITTPIIKPASDSTTAIQITKANGTTNVLDIDTTNVRVGIGTTAPLRKLHVNGDAFLIERNANDPAIIWRNTLDSTYPTQEWILGARVTVSGHLNSLLYAYRDNTNGTSTVIMALTKDGKIGLGTLTPTARLQLPAGTATANTAPLKLTSGVLNTVSEAGTMEFNTDDLYFTTTTGAGVGATYAKYPPVQSSTYVTSTTRYSTSYYAYFTTNPARSLTGSYTGNQWISSTGSTTNQRFHIDLGSAQTITRIYYENSHNSGTVTNTGVKNFTLWGSNTASDFSDLVYANDGTWVQLPTEVTQFEEHVASDTTDPKYIEVTNTTAYRYYAFKFADNWGATTFMGARRIELWNTSTLDGRRNIITSNDGKLTAGRIPYATTNGRLKDSKKLTFDGLTLTVPSVRVAYVAKTADYTLTASDYTVECTANTFTISLPTAVGITGRIYNIKNTGTGTITVDANDSETIDGELTQTVAQWENLQIQSNGTNWIIL